MSPLPLLRRALLLLALLGLAVTLAGCEQVAVIKSAPVAVSYDSKAGNSAVAAADAASLQQALRLRGQLWTIRVEAEPAGAGNVDLKDAQQVRTARGKFTSLVVTLTTAGQSTVEGFTSRGPQSEQAYCEALIQAFAQAGYTNLTSIRVEVYVATSHHATLTWQASTGFVYKVLDGKP
jgi:hypothetical protein